MGANKNTSFGGKVVIAKFLLPNFLCQFFPFCIADKKPVLAEEEVGLIFFLKLLFKINQ